MADTGVTLGNTGKVIADDRRLTCPHTVVAPHRMGQIAPTAPRHRRGRTQALEETMKLYVGLLAATAAIALAGPGRADDSDKFVVRGDATKVIMEQNQINVATAEAISKGCVEEAVKQGVRVSIVIYDQFGEPVYMYRMDGQAKVAIETA